LDENVTKIVKNWFKNLKIMKIIYDYIYTYFLFN